jgi:outer membrane murein-binding lipoprotein Lpp
MIVTCADSCTGAFKVVLKHLVDAKRLNVHKCDDILAQFNAFLNEAKKSKRSRDFKEGTDHIDTLYYDMLALEKKYAALWEVIKKLLLLSHGQATIERSFSVNKGVSVDNLSEHKLIARRMVKDHLNHVGGLDGIIVSKELLDAVQASHARYQAYLEAKRVENAKNEKSKKRKQVELDVADLRAKKARLDTDVKVLLEEAEVLADKAEKCRKHDLIVKSNSHRRSAKQKGVEITELEKKIGEMEKVLVNC